ncbi:MAG: cation transporter [Planctomycetota bacterium]|jgi:copper chaperone CopZ
MEDSVVTAMLVISNEGDNRMMWYKFWFLVLSTLLICGTGCTATNSDVSVKSTVGSENRVYEVFGMNCPACHGGLEKLVKRIPAVQQAEANWKEKQLVVVARPGTELNDEDIYDAIRRSNFTAGKRIK